MCLMDHELRVTSVCCIVYPSIIWFTIGVNKFNECILTDLRAVVTGYLDSVLTQ